MAISLSFLSLLAFENEADKAAVRPLDVAHRLRGEIIDRRRVCHRTGCRTATRQARENMFLCGVGSVHVHVCSGKRHKKMFLVET